MQSALAGSAIESVIANGGVHPVYQPVVRVADGSVVGFEALARGPAESELEMPARLFPAAEESGLRVELERECLRVAFEGAARFGLNGGSALFVNLEPYLLADAELDRLARLTERTRDRLNIVVELTERDLLGNPTELLAAVDRMRALGMRIALDDVGADTRSLALIPFLQPEVIKLDLRLVQDRPRSEAAAIVHAVGAEAERTGATLLAEGIETTEHLERARALGATLGQGWYFGRPGPLSVDIPVAAAHIPSRSRVGNELPSPFGIVAAERAPRIADKRLLLALSRELEEHAYERSDSTVMIASFQRRSFYSAEVASRYAMMAERMAFIGALGAGPDPVDTGKVRWGQLGTDDPLIGEWDVAVIGPHFAAAFVANDLGDDVQDLDRRFDFAITYERELAVRAARAMMRRFSTISER